MQPFSDLALAAYCPRKLYYRRRDDGWEPPPEVRERREIAYRYPELLADDDALAAAPIAVTPTQFRTALSCARARLDAWDALVDPADRDVRLEGKDCRGVVHKVLADPLAPSMLSTGEPPGDGVWETDGVRAVAAAKALAWERETPVERAFVEYPRYGVIRDVELTARRTGAYRRALRAAESIDGPPPRLRGSPKCESCEYRETCGVRTRSLASLL